MHEKRLVLLTNIPTPYRLYFYDLLHQECEEQGIRFEVWFMAATEPGRYWPVELEAWSFHGHIMPGLHPRFRGAVFHFNPQVAFNLIRRPPDWLIASGWQLPTNIIAQMIPNQHSYKLIWAEANRHASRYQGGIMASYRHRTLSDADAVIVPGEMARSTLTDTWEVNPKRLLYLPNLVDEHLYRDKVNAMRPERDKLRHRYQLTPDRRVLFWMARLVERKKGILNFLEAVQDVPVTILLAGDGEDRPLIEEWARQHPDFDLQILGHVSQSVILECLTLSDVAILPSFSDPNPLTMIEAIWAGLPILTSTHCGNWPETVKPGFNGWLVDPMDQSALRAATEEIYHCDETELQAMGQHSLELAQQNFDSRRKTREFVTALVHNMPVKMINEFD